MGITFVRQYERLAKSRWGAFKGILGPGVHWLWPLLDTGLTVDLREKVARLSQEFTTNDLRQVDVTGLVYYRVIEQQVETLVLNMPSPWPNDAAVVKMATEILKDVIGDAPTVSSLADLRQIGDVLRSRLNTSMRHLGMTVTGVKVDSIRPKK
ncbi:MAG: SPFH domain-containing protein [Dehalococcoidia bacterium]